MEQIVNFIKNVKDQDFNAANSIFADLMTDRVNGVMDTEKVKIADQVFNGAEPENDTDDIEDDTDDVEENENEEEDEEATDEEL